MAKDTLLQYSTVCDAFIGRELSLGRSGAVGFGLTQECSKNAVMSGSLTKHHTK
jgi:hypothetical protein